MNQTYYKIVEKEPQQEGSLFPTYVPSNINDLDIIYAAIIMGIHNFISENRRYIEDPSSLANIEEVNLDGWSVEGNLDLNFPKVQRYRVVTDEHGYKAWYKVQDNRYPDRVYNPDGSDHFSGKFY